MERKGQEGRGKIWRGMARLGVEDEEKVTEMAGVTWDEALERCEDELWRIGEAVELLGKVREMEDVTGDLEYRRNALEEEAEGLRGRILAREAREEEALRTEYESGLM